MQTVNRILLVLHLTPHVKQAQISWSFSFQGLWLETARKTVIINWHTNTKKQQVARRNWKREKVV